MRTLCPHVCNLWVRKGSSKTCVLQDPSSPRQHCCLTIWRKKRSFKNDLNRYWDSREETALKGDKLSYHWYKVNGIEWLINIKSFNFGLRIHSSPWNVSTEEYVQAVNGDPLTISNLDETSNVKRMISVPKNKSSKRWFDKHCWKWKGGEQEEWF